jgi:hypothetical protein
VKNLCQLLRQRPTRRTCRECGEIRCVCNDVIDLREDEFQRGLRRETELAFAFAKADNRRFREAAEAAREADE